MSSGCFSRFPLLQVMHWKSKITKKKYGKLPENESTIVSATKEYTSVEDRVMEKKKSSEKPWEVFPKTTKHIPATRKQDLMLLESTNTFIPVLKAIGTALNVFRLCEKISALERKVNELQDSIYHLIVVVVDNGDEVIAKVAKGIERDIKDVLSTLAAKGIERDIKDVLSTLAAINEELEKITARGPQGIYSDLNTSRVDDCLNRLSELHARLAKIENLIQQVENKVNDVHEGLKSIKHILAKTRQSDTVVQQMPLKPGVFHGRDDTIEEITQLLMNEKTSRVCILGPVGMGKTSVSLGVVEQPLIKTRFLPENLVWVPCIEATSATLLLKILSIQLQVPENRQVTIEEIISLLDTSTQPRLILLDNFETPYNALDGKQVEYILRRLDMLSHVAILITMRGRYPPCDKANKWYSKNIRPTNEAACLRIYHDIHPGSENDCDVGRLLRVLGHMPLAVTLMARLAKEGRSTAKELLSEWSEYGPDILPNHHYEQNLNRSISLSVDSYLMKQNPQALLLLKILSCLPAGTTKENLRWCAPSLRFAMVPSAIATLSKAGLLVENERQDSDSPVLFVLPVVQSFMQQQGRIEDEIRHNIQSSCYHYVP